MVSVNIGFIYNFFTFLLVAFHEYCYGKVAICACGSLICCILCVCLGPNDTWPNKWGWLIFPSLAIFHRCGDLLEIVKTRDIDFVVWNFGILTEQHLVKLRMVKFVTQICMWTAVIFTFTKL